MMAMRWQLWWFWCGGDSGGADGGGAGDDGGGSYGGGGGGDSDGDVRNFLVCIFSIIYMKNYVMER